VVLATDTGDDEPSLGIGWYMMTGQGSASDSLFGVKGIHNTTCGSTTYVRSTPRAQIELTENNNDFHTDASLQCELPLRQGIWTHYIVYTNHPS